MGLTRSSLSSADQSISKGLSADFSTYVNSIGFKDPSTGNILSLTSTSNGYYQNGSYYEYVMGVINDAITRYNSYNNANIPLYSTTDTTALYSFVSTYKNASKGLGAFDDYKQKSNPENTLFGIAGTAGHFDQFLAGLVETYAPSYYPSFQSDLASTNVDAVGKTVEERLMMYTPLYYLIDDSTYYSGGGSGSSDVALYWRIRTGIDQGDAPLNTEIDLSLALQNYSGVKSVDFETIWGQGHTMAEDTGDAEDNFIAWVEEKCPAVSGIKSIINPDNAVTAYSYGKVIYINGKLTGSDAVLISMNVTIIGNYKLTKDGLTTLNESSLQDGIYILQVNTESKLYTFKLIIKKVTNVLLN